ncbi:hypothetical protein [Clostridium grantii]|uniref:DUF5666 domain-containing protein n=1 Tax=Clostridium grantii DSM 8605 TaxID=1121316 RepID=A0A1M5WP07_9CLOT|nr:hypothetical protein [Clostridium grantii]SHH89306.1 hypothetical protein SAMN02745207_03023 [Clostridium grantii DSM 8605]
MKKNNILTIIIIVLGMFMLTSCGTRSNDQGLPMDNNGNNGNNPGMGASLLAPDIIGEVLEVRNDGDLALLIDSTTDNVKGQVWVTITEETNFFENESPDSSLGIANISRDFQVGNKVSISSTGAIAESDPMQATANAVYSNESMAK